MTTENKKKNWKSFLFSLLFGASFGFIMVLLPVYKWNVLDNLEWNLSTALNVLIFLLLLLIALYAHIIIHEAGHFLFGRLTGYKAVSFRVLSLTFVFSDSGVSIKRFNLPGTAGQCLMSPPPMRNGSYPFVLFFAGGVMMNLFTAFVMLFIAILVPTSRFWLFPFIFIGFFLGITNALPHASAAIPNDGASLLKLIRSRKFREAIHAQLSIYARLSEGTRLKELPEKYFSPPAGTDFSDYNDFYTQILRYARCLDEFKLDEAADELLLLESASKTILPYYQLEYHCEKLFCLCAIQDRQEEARKLYDEKLKDTLPKLKSIDKRRILMAYSWFTLKDKYQALTFCQEAEKLADSFPLQGLIPTELALVHWIQTQIEEGADESSSERIS